MIAAHAVAAGNAAHALETGFSDYPETPYRWCAMPDAADFDDLYASARDRLLLQTYALTGDLPAARSAVRYAFVAAWHHWRKVSKLEDPEAWIRPQAWSQAQRRHTGRIWHRDKNLDDQARATLDALAKLSLNQRKALLLNHLSTITMEQMAREIGLTDDAAAAELQLATAQFALHRDVASTSVRVLLEQIEKTTADVRFPRSTIVRRGGAARRRAHTTFGVAACVGALLGAGAIVHHSGGVTPALSGVEVQKETEAAPLPEAQTYLDVDDLLMASQVSTALGKRKVGAPVTSDNTTGTGLNTACQRTRFADPAGLAALVRTFPVAGKPADRVTQSVELSASEKSAEATYATTLGWYTSCQDERAQLISAYDLTDMGDQGMVLILNTWASPVHTWVISVVRTGKLVTTIARRLTAQTPPKATSWVTLTEAATARLCSHEAAGTCPGASPKANRAAPPTLNDSPGLLQVIDLPPVSGVDEPWVGTEPSPAKTNPASTVCDKTNFSSSAIKNAVTRSFVIPEAKLSNSFGLTETVGEFASPAKAKAFLTTVEKRIDACEEEDPAAEVKEIERGTEGGFAYRVWRVSIEVGEDRLVDFDVAIIQRRTHVAQLSFVRDGRHRISDAAFHALTLRASSRLAHLAD